MGRFRPAISPNADDSVLKFATMNVEASRFYSVEERQAAKVLLIQRHPRSLTYKTLVVKS